MRQLFTAFSIFICSCISAQTFPSQFLGHWEGELLWYQGAKNQPQKNRMQLIVQPTDTANQYTWQIIYGEKGSDNRPYILKPVDTAKGHWVIDERIGIVLDQYWIGNRFCGAFTISSSTIQNCYWREKKKLIVEFIAFAAKPVSKTGLGTEDVPYVDSYQVRTYQRAVLKKKKKGNSVLTKHRRINLKE